MHVGLSGFLKHLGFLIRLFRLKDSQFFLIILHYYTLRYICLINYLILSNVFLNVLLTTSCLYEHEINNFFVRRLISTKNCSNYLSSVLNEYCLDGISSLTKGSIPPQFGFLSVLYGGVNLSIKTVHLGNFHNFVSDIVKISKLILTRSFNKSN